MQLGVTCDLAEVERNRGIPILRAPIHANNTTGAGLVTIRGLKSVVTTLPGGVLRLLCGTLEVSVVERYFPNITWNVIFFYSSHE